MRRSTKQVGRVGALLALAFALIVGVPVIADGPFAENNVVVIHSFVGENVGDAFGWLGADLGDIDGDGAHDFLLTAPFYGENSEGKVYVYSGQDGTLINEIVGDAGSLLGYSARGAGDVDADGVPDYILGGPGRVAVPSSILGPTMPCCSTCLRPRWAKHWGLASMVLVM